MNRGEIVEHKNLNITNKDVVINNENTNCVYEVIKDNKKIDEGICKNITLTSNGSYEVIFKDSLTNSITTYKYVIDKEPPKIKLEQKKSEIYKNLIFLFYKRFIFNRTLQVYYIATEFI